jgi:hypothetical protein
MTGIGISSMSEDAFKEMSILMQERVKMKKKTKLKRAGLWQFLSDFAILWPSQCKLRELVNKLYTTRP